MQNPFQFGLIRRWGPIGSFKKRLLLARVGLAGGAAFVASCDFGVFVVLGVYDGEARYEGLAEGDV